MKQKDSSPQFEAGSLLANLLTPAELATELGVSERCVHIWHSRRIGPPRIVIGRKPFYRRASVAAWIERQEIDPAAQTRGHRRRVVATSPAA
jgi:hypothetical protein